MSRAAPMPPQLNPLVGRRVRIRCEGEVTGHYASGPTAPERVQVKIGGIITIVPIANVEVVP